jgi:hypothetical protein
MDVEVQAELEITYPEQKTVYSSRSRAPRIRVTNSGGGDFAEVVFIIVGTIASVTFIFYAINFVYDQLTGDHNVVYWTDISASSTFFSSASTALNNGILSGIKFSTGFISDYTHIGLAGEIGGLDVNLTQTDDSPINVSGSYWMVGPAIHFAFSRHFQSSYLSLELLSGTSNSQKDKFISVARIGGNFPIGERFRIGFTIGSLLVDLKQSQGFLRQDSHFNTLLGVDAGIRF